MAEARDRHASRPQLVSMKQKGTDGMRRPAFPDLPRPASQSNAQSLKSLASNAVKDVPPPLNSYILKAKQIKDLSYAYPKIYELEDRVVVPLSKIKDMPAYRHVPHAERSDDISVLVCVAKDNLSYYQKLNLLVKLLNLILNTTTYLRDWVEEDYCRYIAEKKKCDPESIKGIYDPAEQPADKLLRDPEYLPDLGRFFTEHRIHRPELYKGTISLLSNCFASKPLETDSSLLSGVSTPTASSFSSALSEPSTSSSLSVLSAASVSAELRRRKDMSAAATTAANSLATWNKNAELQALKEVLRNNFDCQRIVTVANIEKHLKRKLPKANCLRLLKELATTNNSISLTQGEVTIDWVQVAF